MMQSRFPPVLKYGEVTLTLEPKHIYVEFAPNSALLDRSNEHGLNPVEDKSPSLAASFNEVHKDRRWFELTEGHNVDSLYDNLVHREDVKVVSPVYYKSDMTPTTASVTFSNFVLVKVERESSSEIVDRLFREHGKRVSGPIELSNGDLYRLELRSPKEKNALEVSSDIKDSPIVKEARPDWMSLTSSIDIIPNDSYFGNQWALSRISAPAGWDITIGDPNIVVAILDTGCDLNHQDLISNYVPPAQRRNSLDPTNPNQADDEHGHGTCCAGVAAARIHNYIGIAGIAGHCHIMPIKMVPPSARIRSEIDIIDAINWARTHNAKVISMSWHFNGPHSDADDALTTAYAAGMILVAAAGNYKVAAAGNNNQNMINWPASHPSVMAIGASDQNDTRKTPSNSPDGQCWGSKYGYSLNGSSLSLMAPGVLLWTTDITGAGGFNTNNGGSQNIPELCINTTSCGSTDGHYWSQMGGTSGATTFAAGLAALLLSRYPTLSNEEVREIIEKTAEKVGGYTYQYDPSSHPNGTWNEQMGYGRINIARALNFAETYIKDSPADNGKVPFTSEPFWNNSDIVIRRADDNIFAYQSAIQGQDNYVYVRVTNKGPADAHNVRVNVRGVAYVGTEFIYPDDWSVIDSVHLQPTDILSTVDPLPAGDTFIAKFSFDSSQINTLYGWQTTGWHPCILAEVRADNDYGVPVDGIHSWEHNDLAQRNISVGATAITARTGAQFIFPFIMGHRNNKDSFMELAIEIPELPQKSVLMFLDPFDEENYFPALESLTSKSYSKESRSNKENNGRVSIQEGAQWSSDKGRQMIVLKENKGRFRIKKNPGELCQMVLKLQVLDDNIIKEKMSEVKVSQINSEGKILGGASFHFRATNDKN